MFMLPVTVQPVSLFWTVLSAEACDVRACVRVSVLACVLMDINQKKTKKKQLIYRRAGKMPKKIKVI